MPEGKRRGLVARISVVITGVLVTVWVFYVVVGCRHDWLVAGGLLLDGIGASLLARPDLKRFSEGTRLFRLKRATEEMDALAPISVEPGSDLFGVLDESIRNYESLDEPQRIDIGEENVEVAQEDGSVVVIERPRVELELVSQIENLERSPRQIGLSLLVVGFGVQLVGTASSSTLLLDVLGVAVRTFGVPYAVC
ncbi:MAG: hypothetical protein ABEI75_00735 [Halobaculum sp.]